MSALGASRGRLAWLLLAPLLTVIAYGAASAQWHSCPSVDCRTYVEMVRGIAEHGLPYLQNGPITDFPDLQARWNVVHGGRLWGTYPPFFPYAATIPFLLGGLPGIAHFNGALLGALALGVFALGRKYTSDPLAGTAAAYIVVASTPACAASLDLGPYVMAVTLITWAAFFTLASLEETGARAHRRALLAGLLGAFAVGAHLLNLPLLASLLVVLTMAPIEGSPSLLPLRFRDHRFAPFAPTRASLSRGLWAFSGSAIPLFAMALLNRARFGSWNPVTYGPCVWRSCEETGLAHQSAGAMFAYALMTFVWAALTVGVAWYARRSARGLLIVGAASIALLVGYEPLRRHTSRIALVFWGYLVDCDALDMSPMVHPADGLGQLFGAAALKSTLQCTPFIALAVLAPFTLRRARRATLAMALPTIGLLVLLSLRANLAPVQALGFSFLYLRYVLPALPLLVVLGIGAVRDLPWTWKHVLLTVAAAAALGACIQYGEDDAPYWRRFILLRVTLAAGGGALLLAGTARVKQGTDAWKKAATIATAAAIACGIAVTLTVDFQVSLKMQVRNDRSVDDLARLTPERFALVGWPDAIDPVLSLRASRDLEYLDLYESVNWFNFRQMIDRWSAEGRPIFALLPWGITSPWPDVAFEIVDARVQLYRISLRTVP